jgi:protein O-mannosyl-transferase
MSRPARSGRRAATPTANRPEASVGAVPRWREIVRASLPLRVAAMGLLLAGAFGGALRAGVAWDDLEVLSANPAIRTLARPWRFFTDSSTIGPLTPDWLSQYRPLRTLAYALQFAVFRGEAWGYHLVSLLLHALGAAAVGRLAARIFGRGGWLAATIWLIHPALSENALSLTAQGNLLCVTLTALALAWHLQWLEAGGAGRRSASLGAALGAMLAYESGVLVPVLVALAELSWRLAGRRGRRSHWLYRQGPFWGLLAVFLAIRQWVTAPIPVSPWWGGSWAASALMQMRVWVEGWRLTLAPAGMLIRYKPADIPAAISPALAVALHVALLALVVALAARRRGYPLILAVAWWYLAQAPTSNLLLPNPGYPFAPRFLFLALILPVAAAAAWLTPSLARRPALAVALVSAVLLAVVADRVQTSIWRNSGTVFAAMAEHDPADFGAQFNLGWYQLKSGDLPAAAEHLARARAAGPSDGRPDYLIGEAALAAGRRDIARDHFVRSLEIERRQIEPRVRLARMEIASGQLEQAAAWVSAIPGSASGDLTGRAALEITLAELAAARREGAEARDHVRRALQYRPASSRITFDAAAVLHRLGDEAAARELFREAAGQAGDEYLNMVGETRLYP